MSDRLPKFIAPLLLTERGRGLEGELELSGFPRLAELLADKQGTAVFELSFFKQDRQAVLQGRIATVLILRCQNCLQKLDWPVDCEFRLGIVASLDEANLLPDDLEPLLIGQEKTILNDIIEEELLLSVPLFPKHAKQCFDHRQYAAAPAETKQTRTDNPFAVLATLKK